jgi:hypothetical protein
MYAISLLLRPFEVLRLSLRLPVERWCNSDDFIGPNLPHEAKYGTGLEHPNALDRSLTS